MARGWESKAVESQIESAANEVRPSLAEPLQAEELNLLRKKETLLLSRTRVIREIEASHNPRYRSLLEKALSDLNADLARIEHGAVRAASA